MNFEFIRIPAVFSSGRRVQPESLFWGSRIAAIGDSFKVRIEPFSEPEVIRGQDLSVYQTKPCFLRSHGVSCVDDQRVIGGIIHVLKWGLQLQ